MNEINRTNEPTGLEIAVIGMAVRFPGAKNIDEFWENLKNGIESITFFSEEELAESGVDPQRFEDCNYVKAAGILEGLEYFDASFFDYTPREAEMMDPQLRLLHEVSWEALEHAGYDPDTYKGIIGMYAGANSNPMWFARFFSQMTNELDTFTVGSLCDTYTFCTRLSYKLNLKGPSVTVQCACSTSLVAIHMAVQGLLCGECDMALAGGVSILLLKKMGYLFQEGMILSPDGHCRTFDARAQGTVLGDGSGIVVLKRLKEAIADGDVIHAIVKGSAFNNDGNRKVGYTAPSMKGQTDVIRAAYNLAGVEPESIGYIEAHGTATAMGDPIEISALKLVFNTGKKGFCRIGSVKSNMGHLNNAAGVVGFIKTVLALKQQLIPPGLHFETPNPEIDFENSAFVVNTEAYQWPARDYPRRAGVNSIGGGGTNAHVVLEEWPQDRQQIHDKKGIGGLTSLPDVEPSRECQLILLSAKTQTALHQATKNLVEYLKRNPGINLADAAYTLQIGRKVFKHKRMLVAEKTGEAVDALTALLEPPSEPPSPTSAKVYTFSANEDNKPVFFMFPGIGSQYANMGLELYRSEPLFRQEMDRCFEILKGLLDYDLKEILYPTHPAPSGHASQEGSRGGSPCPPQDGTASMKQGSEGTRGLAPLPITSPEIAHPLVFAFEYALARLIIRWGIKPNALIGYSFGEYVAACLAGVISLENALKLVVVRSQLIRQTPEGAMLSVPLPAVEVNSFLQEGDGLSIAIDNGPSTIVAGAAAAVDAFENRLKEKRLMCMRVDNSRALHSTMMEPISAAFEQELRHFTRKKPQIPYISNVTGNWMSDEDALDPGYWVTHLKQTVRFADGIKELTKAPNAIFIEIGPGRDLSALLRRSIENNPRQQVINLIRHPQQDKADMAFLLERIGRLWLYGVKIDWEEFYAREKKKRITLPAYPFERKRFRVEAHAFSHPCESPAGTAIKKKSNMADWFYIPLWKQAPPITAPKRETGHQDPQDYLVFVDPFGIGDRLIAGLTSQNREVVTVRIGENFFMETDGVYRLNPSRESDYKKLLAEIGKTRKMPRQVIHLWSVAPGEGKPLKNESLAKAQEHGFYSLIHFLQARQQENINDPLELAVITNNMQAVSGEPYLCPEQSTVLGPVIVFSQENPIIRCRSIDILLPNSDPRSPSGSEDGKQQRLVQQLLAELQKESPEKMVALRENFRWIPTYEPMNLNTPAVSHQDPGLREEGVYLITGGLGAIGLVLARYLAESVKAKLVLTGRSAFPPQDRWEQWLDTHPPHDTISQKIRKIKEIQGLGGHVLVFSANVADETAMRAAISQAEQTFGPINGVIHAAGLATQEHRDTAEGVKKAQCEMHFQGKIYGLLTLQKLTEHKKLDFFVLMSSVSSILGGLGFVAYAAANIFMDSLLARHNRENNQPWLGVNWDNWQLHEKAEQADKLGASVAELVMDAREGVEAFKRILSQSKEGRWIHSLGDLHSRIQQWVVLKQLKPGEEENKITLSREELSSQYAPPRGPLEKQILEIWQNIFGIDNLGIYDDFFELGGDSLKLIAASTKIRGALDVAVPLPELFNRPTIEELAMYIHTLKTQTRSPVVPVETKEYYGLAPAQQRLYTVQQLDKESIAYNETQVLVLEGSPDYPKLEDIFKELIRRHESFRTSFTMVNEEPVQRIHHASVPDFKIQHLPGPGPVPSSAVEGTPGEYQEVEEIIMGFIRPFDLSQPPLLRAAVLELHDQQYMLVIDKHHIVRDSVSDQILFREITVLYNGKELPLLRVQYKDYAAWQNLPQQQEALAKQELYWLDQFQDDIPVLKLPTDYPRPPFQSFAGNTSAFEIDKEKTAALRQLAAAEETTLYFFLLSIFYILLSKLSGNEDIVVGTPVAGRRHDDLQDIIGMFVNTLALRNFIGSERTFPEFLQGIKANTLNALENQDYPFEKLVNQVSVDRDVSRNPLFDVMFVLQNVDIPEVRDHGLNLSSYVHRNRTSKFDLILEAVENEDQLVFTFEYNTALFKGETIERFIHYFRKILSSVLDNPNREISALEMINREEKARVLYEFNDTSADYPRDKTIHQLFAEQTGRTPDRIALVGQIPNSKSQISNKEVPFGPINAFGETISITYKELNQRAHQVASILRKKGVQSDTIVGIMVERSIDMITGILGILITGGAYLPIAPDYPRERINYMLTDTKVKILLTSGNIFKDLGIVKDLSVLDFEQMNSEFVGSARDFEFRIPDLNPANLCYILYTSGSTGKPKGVLLAHHPLVNLIEWMNRLYPMKEKDVVLLQNPFTFDMSVWGLYAWSFYGASTCLLAPGAEKDAQQVIDAIYKYQVTVLHFVPAALSMFLAGAAESRREAKLSSLKGVFVSGEALSVELVKQFNEKLGRKGKTKLYNLYGPTETHVVSYFDCQGLGNPVSVPIGKPISNAQIYILTRGTKQQPVPVGIVGELYAGGVCLGRGYLNRPQLTAEKFVSTPAVPGEWIYKTGDLAKWLPDGNIEFLGRIDNQVKIRGYRIELAEIESHLLGHEEIKNAVVVLKEKKPNDKYLCAYFVSDKKFSVPELEKYLSEKLPDYMIPAFFVRLEKIPLTANDKLDRKNLPDPEGAALTGGEEYLPPHNTIEKTLVEIWESVLGRHHIGVKDNFFRIGGDSIKAMSIVAKITKILNLEIPLTVFFKNPKIREIARFINGVKEPAQSLLKPGEAKEYYVLSPAQLRLYFLQEFDRESIAYHIIQTLVIDGVPDYHRLGKIFRQLIRRHECLRASIIRVNEEPVLRIHHPSHLDFKIRQLPGPEASPVKPGGSPLLTAKNGTYQPAASIDRVIRDVIQPFDLSRAPFLRVAAIEITSRQHILVIDIHHIVYDLVSHQVFLKEVFDLYTGKPLPPLQFQYKDYAQWQKNPSFQSGLEKQEAYWLKQFQEQVPLLNLPADYPRPSIQVYEGDSLYFEIPNPETTAIKTLAANQQTTANVVLLSIFNVLLSKLSSQEEIIVGTPVAGRRHEDLHEILGMFINTLALRNFPVSEKKFSRFLQEVKVNTFNALENQDYPFEKLVDQAPVTRDAGRNPLFDVMFVMQNIHLPEIELPGFTMTPYIYKDKISKFDLAIEVVETDRLQFKFAYSTALFKEETCQRFIRCYEKIVSTVLENPEQKIAEIEIISGDEKRQLLDEFNDTRAVYPADTSIQQLFAEQVQRTPNHIALIGKNPKQEDPFGQINACGEGNLSYKELDERANQLAQMLQEKGVIPDTLVGVMVERSPEMIIGILGILKARGAYLPLDPDYPEERIHYMLKDSNVRVLLTRAKLQVKVKTEAEKNFGHPGGLLLQYINIEKDLASAFEPPILTSTSPVSSNNLAYIIYTSGSTGKPKGVMVQHKGIRRLVKDPNYINWAPGDKLLLTGAMAFDITTFEIWGPLLNGLTLVLVHQDDILNGEELVKIITRHHISILHLVPQLLNQLVEPYPEIFIGLDYFLVGGDLVPPDYVNKVIKINQNLKIIHMYGPTENTTFSTFFPVQQEYDHAIPIGKPINNSTAYVINKFDQLVPIGVPGELIVGGDGVARGYLNNVELTAQKFQVLNSKLIPGKYKSNKSYMSYIYKTGDLARWLPDGNIQFLGRRDHQVKIRGFRIELAEIENQLQAHDKIKKAVVISKNDRVENKYLAAYLVLKEPEQAVNSTELHEYLLKKLPVYMIPSYFVKLEELPLTPNGKIDRKALPEPGEIPLDSGDEYLAARNTLEQKMVETWKNVLGRHHIGINDNFFKIGGDSIKAIQIAARMNKQGYKLEIRDIFRFSSISQLAPLLKKVERLPDQAVITGTVPLTPIQREFFERDDTDLHHFNHAIILYSPEALAEKGIKSVFAKIQEHHDALRMTFKQVEGKIIQINHGLEYPLSVQEYDFKGREDAAEAVERAANQVQDSINLETGPLLKVVLFHLDDGDRLLVVIHHLVVDGVSWRILLEDIERLYRQYENGESPLLPQKSDSFKLWSEKLTAFANSNRLLKTRSYWANLESAAITPIKRDFNQEDCYIKDSRTLSIGLGAEASQDLLTRTNHAFGTEINDILLTALGLAVKKTWGAHRVLIALEGHGREEIVKDININRTIGWFTSIYPVILNMSYENDVARQIKEVKENLRQIPDKGVGYGILKFLTRPGYKEEFDSGLNPRISFNYLGRFDEELEQTSFRIADESCGVSISLKRRQPYELEVSGIITNRQLKLSVSFNMKQYKNKTIKTFLANYKKILSHIISFCSVREKRTFTPSDFTYKQLPIETVDDLCRQYHLENIYTLSPAQEGMLFHVLYDSSPAYVVRTSFRLHGQLDISLLKKSFNQLIKRYDILRAVFVYKGVERPLQLVLQEREVDFVYKDLADISSKSQKDKLVEAFKNHHMNRSFDLSRDVLQRLAVVRVEETEYEFTWSDHHIVLDGWCRGILNKELFEIYYSYLEGRPMQLPPVQPYGNYIEWLQRQDKEKALKFWKKLLDGYKKPALIPRKKAARRSHQYNREEFLFTLGEKKAEALNQLAVKSEVTFSVIFQAVWGLLLAKYNHMKDVVFGIVVSGRPSEIEGVDSMVGLFINTVPVRIRFDGSTTFNQLSKTLQKDSLDSEPYHYVSLAEIQTLTVLKQNLLNHFLTFINYPVENLIEEGVSGRNKVTGSHNLEISNFQTLEKSNYNCDVLINFTRQIDIILRFNTHVYDGQFMRRLAAHIKEVVDQVLENSDIHIDDICLSHERLTVNFTTPVEESDDFEL